jgi:uncharacterized protein YfbU (UPF0304 family)
VSSIAKRDLQKKLELKLERLKKTLELGYELKVKWILGNSNKLKAEGCIEILNNYEGKQILFRRNKAFNVKK